jgi:hypothetical protein
MKKGVLILLLLFIGSTIFLMPGFYRNRWDIVEPVYYDHWQTIFDRSVVARLVMTRQDGFLSAGGLLGLGDVEEWNFLSTTHKHQYDVYNNGGKFDTYLVYTSTPGFQGVLYGIPDRLLNLPENVKLKLFRGGTALVSAMVLALVSIWLGVEFGWLAGLLTLIFIGVSEALIRPAGSIYWNLWVFYLPLIANTFLLITDAKNREYPSARLLWINYFLGLLKVLMNGFEGITTFMVMATVPFLYFAILNKWDWKLLFVRVFKLGIVLSAAVVTGLVILSIQIASAKGDFSESTHYIWDAFNRRAIGDPDQYGGLLAESMRASVFDVIWRYLEIEAVTIPLFQSIWNIKFLHLVILFAIFTLIFILRYGRGDTSPPVRKGMALTTATWYSILAPFSWFFVFTPDAYLHTSIYPMLWHMPFTLLGISLCGFVLINAFRRKTN